MTALQCLRAFYTQDLTWVYLGVQVLLYTGLHFNMLGRPRPAIHTDMTITLVYLGVPGPAKNISSLQYTSESRDLLHINLHFTIIRSLQASTIQVFSQIYLEVSGSPKHWSSLEYNFESFGFLYLWHYVNTLWNLRASFSHFFTSINLSKGLLYTGLLNWTSLM